MMVQTEIGLLPEDWEVKAIGECLSIGNGRDYKHLHRGTVPVYGTGGIMTYVDQYLYDGETVCIGRKGTIDNPMYHDGKIWTVDTLFYSHHFKAIPKYMYYAFCQVDWMSYNEATGVPSLTSKRIEEIQVPVPPTTEQQNIASALSSIDKLIDDLGRTIQKKQRIRKGAMEELLCGKKRLPGFRDEWVEKKIGEVFPYIKNGASYDIKNTSGYPMTRIETISKGVINHKMVGFASEEPVKYKMQTGDILFSHINSVPYIGRVAYYYGDRPLYHGMNVLLLRTKAGYDTLFLFYLLASKKMKKYFESIAKQAINQASINTKELSEVMIYIPSDIQEQHVIADILTSMDDEISLLESERAKYEQIRSGMMEDLLTGKKRLINK